MNEKIKFKVGDEYENVKGVYKVISIKGQEMTIRWVNGEQIKTTIEFQRNIIERIQREKKEREKKKIQDQKKGAKKKGAKTRSTSGYGSKFAGLQDSDFKNNANRTNWRSRPFLGGAVTRRFYAEGYEFDSWAFHRMPSVRWQDKRHRKREEAWLQAKFSVQVDENCLYYGFYIERSDDPADDKDDWVRLISWLKNTENETWLRDIAGEHNLIIYDLDENGFKWTIGSSGEEWNRESESGAEKISSLPDYLDNLPKKGRVDLHISKKIDKDLVLKKGEKIADDISSIFGILMPLYAASTPPVK